MKTILFIIYILCAAVLLYYWIKVFAKLNRYTQKKINSNQQRPLSIIIAAYNEADNLRRFLPKILEQEYFQFEVVLIDDHSADETGDVIRELNSERISYKKNKEGQKGKKSAITYGVEMAKYQYLVFIDADCYPNSKYWLQEINASFNEQNDLILGHGRFEKTKGLLNKLIRYENVLNATQYLSFAISGIPYMGVGRNMAYSKELFVNSNRFESHQDINSGDDDLFVNENADSAAVGVMINSESHTISRAKSSLKEYIVQKRRHLQAGTRYKSSHKLILAVYGASQFMFSAIFLVLLLIGFRPMQVLLVFSLKELIQIFIFKDICDKLEDQQLIIWKPFLEALFIFTIAGIGISTWIWKVSRWK